MSMTNFRAEDMPGARKQAPVEPTEAPKKAKKSTTKKAEPKAKKVEVEVEVEEVKVADEGSKEAPVAETVEDEG